MLPKAALAATATCTTTINGQYGTSSTCTQGALTIQKTVQNPSNGNFVNNLTSNDYLFNPLSTITFQIVVTNTGNADLTNLVIKDVLPQYVDFASTSNGGFDGSKTVIVNEGTINAGVSDSVTITARVEDSNTIPANVVTCEINQSFAYADNQSQVQSNAGFCLQNPQTNVTPTPTSTSTTTTSTSATPTPTIPAPTSVPSTTSGGVTVFPTPRTTSTPSTGADPISLLGLIPAAFAGFKLRQKNK